MKKLSLAVCGCLALSHFSVLAAGDHDISGPHTHAPIGVMGDHTHDKGEFMFSYRYMEMSMSGNLQAQTVFLLMKSSPPSPTALVRQQH